ncbi:hypothetical protein BLNAU_15273 [Blattamonas nauphoetae]|uniref:SPRY domain-containing protein n=1 Tax=Blattamonas nauphoetae TaxID=2049346 RepID=A0ABQ9XB87_9EUKA|nr:hypothetical protein BLNAU_15273 [Blattamonas nauphoetae]
MEWELWFVTMNTASLCEGEWELKIRGGREMFLSTRFAYFSHPELNVRKGFTIEKPRFSGSFSLARCLDWKSRTNTDADNAVPNEPDRTAAIRVNMERREARLFVDDVQQSTLIQDLPPLLNLSIISAFTATPYTFEVVHLKRLDDNPENSPPSLPNTSNCWPGTNSIETFDRTGHVVTPTQIVPRVILELDPICYTAYTFPIEEGKWELKIRMRHKKPRPVDLGFVRFPLPAHATTKSCGSFGNGIGGAFSLSNGAMWSGEMIKPAGTNKVLEARIEKPPVVHRDADESAETSQETSFGTGGGYTLSNGNRWGSLPFRSMSGTRPEKGWKNAAIQVDMETREARLFVNDEEQPGIFTDIPEKLCLAVSTGFIARLFIVELIHLKRLDIPDEPPQTTPSPDTQAGLSSSATQKTQETPASTSPPPPILPSPDDLAEGTSLNAIVDAAAVSEPPFLVFLPQPPSSDCPLCSSGLLLNRLHFETCFQCLLFFLQMFKSKVQRRTRQLHQSTHIIIIPIVVHCQLLFCRRGGYQ